MRLLTIIIIAVVTIGCVIFLTQTAALIVITLFFSCLALIIVFKSRENSDQEVFVTNSPSPQKSLPFNAETLANQLDDAIIFFNASGTVLFTNQQAQKYFPGMNNGFNIFVRFRAPELQHLLQQVVTLKHPMVIDYQENAVNPRWFSVSAAVLEQDIFIVVFRDRTESHQLDRMRSDFIANASHELRTPLASLRGFIETLQGPARNDAKAHERFLAIMQDQAERMARLIDDLLSLSRLEMQTGPGKTENIDLQLLLDHVVTTLSPLAHEHHVVINRRGTDLPLIVSGNRDDFIQLFQNLIENACKYGHQGEHIDVILSREGHQARIDVRDYGPGIAEEHIPRLTERFYRVDIDNSRATKGTGLGLAIVKHILARHMGRLTITSEQGKGATFTIRLELANQ